MKNITLMIVVLTICTGLAMSQPTDQVAGNMPSAELLGASQGDYRDITVQVFAEAPVDNGPITYQVDWTIVWPFGPTVDDPYGGFYQLQVFGRAPANAVKSQGTKLLSVDVDLTTLTPIPGSPFGTVYKCAYTGIYYPAYTCALDEAPVSAPLRGTFTSNLGEPESSATSIIGTTEEITFSEDGEMSKGTSNGQWTVESCVFSGEVGFGAGAEVGVAVLTPPLSGNCTLRIFKGKTSYSSSQ